MIELADSKKRFYNNLLSQLFCGFEGKEKEAAI